MGFIELRSQLSKGQGHSYGTWPSRGGALKVVCRRRPGVSQVKGLSASRRAHSVTPGGLLLLGAQSQPWSQPASHRGVT